MECDLISVVIPVYNVETYIRNCVETVLNQTYNRNSVEIILVDDGSTDSSSIICDEYANNYERVSVIHKKNGGLSDARNVGIDAATGKWITFIDSDDYLSTDCFDYLYKLVKSNNADISICTMWKTAETDCAKRKENLVEEVFDNQSAIREMLYGKKYSTSACAKLYKRELLSEVRFPIGKFSEDMFTTYKILNKASKIVFGNQICYYYLARQNSIVNSGFSKKHMDVIDALDQLAVDIPLDEYDARGAYAAQMIECITNMMERNPAAEDIRKLGLWDRIKNNRMFALQDRNTTKRSKGYAALSFLGLKPMIFIVQKYYQRKWGK